MHCGERALPQQHHLKQREVQLNQRNEDLQRRKNELEAMKENVEAQKGVVERKQEELDKLHAQEREKLEAISGLSADEARRRPNHRLHHTSTTSLMMPR